MRVKCFNAWLASFFLCCKHSCRQPLQILPISNASLICQDHLSGTCLNTLWIFDLMAFMLQDHLSYQNLWNDRPCLKPDQPTQWITPGVSVACLSSPMAPLTDPFISCNSSPQSSLCTGATAQSTVCWKVEKTQMDNLWAFHFIQNISCRPICWNHLGRPQRQNTRNHEGKGKSWG